MKKNKTTLLILTFLYCSPSFALPIEDIHSTSVIKIKSSNKRSKPSTETERGWYSSDNKIKISYTQAKEIGHFAGGKLYGYIDPSFTDSQWQIALAKGFTKTAKGTNGIKFLNNSVLELKIKGDTRLYTTEVHKNDQGDYIAIFDRQARHKKMTKIANKNKLKIHAYCFYKTIRK